MFPDGSPKLRSESWPGIFNRPRFGPKFRERNRILARNLLKPPKIEKVYHRRFGLMMTVPVWPLDATCRVCVEPHSAPRTCAKAAVCPFIEPTFLNRDMPGTVLKPKKRQVECVCCNPPHTIYAQNLPSHHSKCARPPARLFKS